MINFKLYFFSSAGRIVDRVDLEHANEGTARAAVPRLATGEAMELWCGARRVETYPAGQIAAAKRKTWPHRRPF